jgi:hypothetical protein
LILIKSSHGKLPRLVAAGTRTLSTRTHQVFGLSCRTCGQSGHLRLTENGQRDWSFTTVGFLGLAVNRHNPVNSVIRCNGCGSPLVVVAPADLPD